MTGPRGTLTKSFRHMDLELTKVGKNKLRVDIWFANRKQLACLQTICGHIKNMFKGVLHVRRVGGSTEESPLLVPSLSLTSSHHSLFTLLSSPSHHPPFHPLPSLPHPDCLTCMQLLSACSTSSKYRWQSQPLLDSTVTKFCSVKL